MRAKNRRFVLAGLAFAVAGLGGHYAFRFARRGAVRTAELYAKPLSAPTGPMKVFHLGHSLVGRDMPEMLAQLAQHEYHSQLGWGASLKDHWEPGLEINGFEEENAHPRHRAARESIETVGYDALILTEMVEITDAIRYHGSASYVAAWANLARNANPDARTYVYETWHNTDDAKGWLSRIDEDLIWHWKGSIINPAMADLQIPIYLIPAGQVMAAFVRQVENDEVAGMQSRNDLFGLAEDGTPDTIHFNDIGAYLVALVHYAVLYQRSPVGLPHALLRADGSKADAPSPEVAAIMQQTVWDVVRAHPETGVPG